MPGVRQSKLSLYSSTEGAITRGGGGGRGVEGNIPLEHGLYGDEPLDKVRFLTSTP